MSYLALARKWRPQNFEAICGQEHVTQTLKNAITQDRVHHAFLFCGARGVGKTTAARVLAKALNCENGPTPDPCGVCPACTEISQGVAMDVLEIDGASNRGIGEIRELRDGVAYAPQRDRTKIYIIDEVHMLTSEAFNALLKTLEEPPSHVKFIFATTEPQKIPVTILSRCQRFDFKRIGQEVMSAKLSDILSQENIALDEGALRLVVRESEGSMRDALSLLDRIISFSGADANAEDVARILGVADRQWLHGLVQCALAGDAKGALVLVHEIFGYGVNLKQLMHDLVHYLRDIIVLRVAPEENSLIDLTAQERQTLMNLGSDHAIDVLQRMFRMVSSTVDRVAQSSFPRLELEMIMVRMCELTPIVPVDILLSRVHALERRLEGGAEALEGKKRPFEPPARPSRPAHSNAPASPVEAPQPPRSPAPTPPEKGLSEVSTPQEPAVAEGAAPINQVPPPPPAENLETPIVKEEFPTPPPVPQEAASPPTPKPVAKSVEAEPKQEEEVAPAPTTELKAKKAEKKELAPTPPAPNVDDATAAPSMGDDATPLVLSRPQAGEPTRQLLSTLNADAWERFVDVMRKDEPMLAATFDHGEWIRSVEGRVEVGFEGGSFNARRAEDQRSSVLPFLQKAFEGVSELIVIPVEQVTECPFKRRALRHEVEMARRHRVITEHPAVTEMISQFDGELVQVRVFEKEERDGS